MERKLRIALLGAGKIATMQAYHLCNNPKVEIVYVYDIIETSAKLLANKLGIEAVSNLESVLNDKSIDAVFISTSTSSHVDLIVQCAKAGKHVYCEKPISHDLKSALWCKEQLIDVKVSIHIGFNRRYDPNVQEIKESLEKGEIGNPEMTFICGRDCAPLTKDYLSKSGGFFRDVVVHDLDLTKYLLRSVEDDVADIYVAGSCLHNKDCYELGDFDTAITTIKSKKGIICNINNSRNSVYGYDQRIEIFGTKGMIVSKNYKKNSIQRFSELHTESSSPYVYSFIERYSESFRIQLFDFVEALLNNKPVGVSFNDGLESLIMAEYADQSARTGEVLKFNF